MRSFSCIIDHNLYSDAQYSITQFISQRFGLLSLHKSTLSIIYNIFKFEISTGGNEFLSTINWWRQPDSPTKLITRLKIYLKPYPCTKVSLPALISILILCIIFKFFTLLLEILSYGYCNLGFWYCRIKGFLMVVTDVVAALFDGNWGSRYTLAFFTTITHVRFNGLLSGWCWALIEGIGCNMAAASSKWALRFLCRCESTSLEIYFLG